MCNGYSFIIDFTVDLYFLAQFLNARCYVQIKRRPKPNVYENYSIKWCAKNKVHFRLTLLVFVYESLQLMNLANRHNSLVKEVGLHAS